MLKKNCHQVLGSQKSKLTPPELVFQTAGAINPPPTKIGLSNVLRVQVSSDSIQQLNSNVRTCKKLRFAWK